MLIYNIVAPIGGGLRWARSTCVLNDADKGAMKARLGWSPRETLAVRLWTCARALPVAGCTWSEGMDSQRVTGMDTETGPPLASPHACCVVTCLLCCTHRMHSCFLLVAMPLHCRALPRYPRRSNGPAQCFEPILSPF